VSQVGLQVIQPRLLRLPPRLLQAAAVVVVLLAVPVAVLLVVLVAVLLVVVLLLVVDMEGTNPNPEDSILIETNKDGLALMYKSVCFHLEKWPGNELNPYEQMDLAQLKDNLLRIMLEQQFRNQI
jgi:hypothetical protein